MNWEMTVILMLIMLNIGLILGVVLTRPYITR